LIIALLGVAGCAPSEATNAAPPGQRDSRHVGTEATTATSRAVDWLLKRQAEDGGWHSSTYGQMRCGVGNTALVLYALSHLPEAERRKAAPQIQRGYEFLLRNLSDEGFVRGPDGCSDFPNYATALALAALKRSSGDKWKAERASMTQYLLLAQRTPTADKTVFGGWNHTGGSERDLQAPADEDISVTALALEALRRGEATKNINRESALAFLARCQNWQDSPQNDGGFCFKPIADDLLNKAGWQERDGAPFRGRSYASATADGLCALVDAGLPLDDPRVAAATAWLREHEAVDHVPGIPKEDAEVQMRDALVYYYHAALARAAERVPAAISPGHRSAVVARLLSGQQADGSWRNPCPLMREDDPLVATSLALVALSILGEPAQSGDAK
jgi:hypothetical protein